MKPLITSLILTFNRTDLLSVCLESVLQSTYKNHEIIVLDNGSEENISEFVKKHFKDKRIKVLRKVKNAGLTGGFNYGFKFCKGKYVMLLSNDTVIHRDAIKNMVEMMESDEKIGILALKVIQMKNPQYLHSVGSFFTYAGVLYHYGLSKRKDHHLYKEAYYTFSANGSGFMIRKETVEMSGLFEQEFFVAYDESDLCHRVWLSGYTVVYCPKAELLHLWGASQGVGENEENPKVWFLNDRNKITSFMINLSLPNAIVVLIAFNAILVIWFFVNLIRGRVKTASVLPQAYWWHIINFRKTLEKRRRVQNKIRRVSDREMFQKCMYNPKPSYYYLLYKYGVIKGLKKYKDSKLPERILYLSK